MNMMEVAVIPGKVGLHPQIQEGAHYFIDRESIWLSNEGNAYGYVYNMNELYIDCMSLKYFTSV
jgi:hypothetical protein